MKKSVFTLTASGLITVGMLSACSEQPAATDETAPMDESLEAPEVMDDMLADDAVDVDGTTTTDTYSDTDTSSTDAAAPPPPPAVKTEEPAPAPPKVGTLDAAKERAANAAEKAGKDAMAKATTAAKAKASDMARDAMAPKTAAGDPPNGNPTQ